MQFAPGAFRYAALPALAVFPAFFISPAISLLLLVLAVAVLAFHRDPERTPPRSGVVSPADGTVSVIREEGDRVRVGVFMNVTDVHVNRAPIGGRVAATEHVPGAHRPAFSKESDHNERFHVDVADPDHRVTLIAGAFARRIHPYVEEGDDLDRGERIGHVSFGSRADVLLPSAYDTENVVVARGETVRAGETVIAQHPEYP